MQINHVRWYVTKTVHDDDGNNNDVDDEQQYHHFGRFHRYLHGRRWRWGLPLLWSSSRHRRHSRRFRHYHHSSSSELISLTDLKSVYWWRPCRDGHVFLPACILGRGRNSGMSCIYTESLARGAYCTRHIGHLGGQCLSELDLWNSSEIHIKPEPNQRHLTYIYCLFTDTQDQFIPLGCTKLIISLWDTMKSDNRWIL